MKYKILVVLNIIFSIKHNWYSNSETIILLRETTPLLILMSETAYA